MKLDFVEYLRAVRFAFRQASGQWERPIAQKDLLLNDYLNLDVALSELILASETINLNNEHSALSKIAQPAIIDLYATALLSFLMISHKQQWTHLMVLEDADLAKFAHFPQRNLAHQFVGIKTMLWNSYHQKRQSDFAHAWRSFLKLGLVELHLTSAELDQTIRQMLAIAD